MSRLYKLQTRAISRNPRAMKLHADAYDFVLTGNTSRSLCAIGMTDRNAQYDTEGALCWRDPHARSPNIARAVRQEARP